MSSAVRDRIAHALCEGADKFGLAREAFTDQAIFDLEMRHLFEGGWIYVCHESQVAEPNDFLTTWIGRQPVIINRSKGGQLGGFLNTCAHRGATVCRQKNGNKRNFVCPFHGWVYDSTGKLISIRDEAGAGYPPDFDKAAHGLKPVPRVESYRGFVFASLNAAVPQLEKYLDGAAAFIDLIADQGLQGIEVIRGSSSYLYHGNWKLQAENGADGYHVATVHQNYVAVMQRRSTGTSDNQLKVLTPGGVGDRPGGFYAFENGHVVIWSQRANPQDGPNYSRRAEYEDRFGEDRAHWMLGRSRNLGIYPNLFLMDSMSSQIRQWRPLSVNLTEVTTYCYAPVGEPPENRQRRIRQFEDFYNASGMATPDDLAEFQASQQGFAATGIRLNDLSRGAVHWLSGPDELASKSGFRVQMSGPRIDDEGIFVTQHRAWQRRMLAALDQGGCPSDGEALP